MRCPNCGENNDSVRDGIPEEALVPSARVRYRALLWIAAGILLVPLLVWLHAQMPVPAHKIKEETVLWTPFFRLVRGEERQTHPAEFPFVVLLIAAAVSSCKGWAELLTGLRYGVMIKLNPAQGWPEAKSWLLLVASVLVALSLLFGLFEAIKLLV
jgi:hypothetical protein